jgi:hypothetical protein
VVEHADEGREHGADGAHSCPDQAGLMRTTTMTIIPATVEPPAQTVAPDGQVNRR